MLACHYASSLRICYTIVAFTYIYILLNLWDVPVSCKNGCVGCFVPFYHMRVMNCTCILLLAICKKDKQYNDQKKKTDNTMTKRQTIQ